MKIVLLILLIIFLIIFIKIRVINTSIIKQYFKKLSIVVCGKRGKGKDTILSYIYSQRCYKSINCNIPLTKKTTNLIKIKDIMLPEYISRKSIENMDFTKLDFKKYQFLENPTIISDAQINFPNFEDSQLKKEYSSLAISYQVWRHLYNAPLHFNTQNFDRLWKILREQVEDCIKMLMCIRLPHYTILKCRYYENAKDCIDNLKPLKISLLRLVKDDVVKVENSKRGFIKDYFLLIPNKRIQHDSRFYKKIIFDSNTFDERRKRK